MAELKEGRLYVCKHGRKYRALKQLDISLGKRLIKGSKLELNSLLICAVLLYDCVKSPWRNNLKEEGFIQTYSF